jgi:hypothetical protein
VDVDDNEAREDDFGRRPIGSCDCESKRKPALRDEGKEFNPENPPRLPNAPSSPAANASSLISCDRVRESLWDFGKDFGSESSVDMSRNL